MNKKLIVIAVASVMAMPLTVNASGKHKVYGAVNVSVDKRDESGAMVKSDGIHGSKIGMKGSMNTNISDFKAIYQIEAGMKFGIDTKSGKDLDTGFVSQRDTWAGLSSKSMGTMRVGTMATHYKQTGAMTDVLFSVSAAAGRGLLGTQSNAQQSGTGAGRGRGTQMIRYDSPTISGAKVIAHYQLTELENNLGLGLQYKARNYLAFFDYIDVKTVGGEAVDKTAMKFGGKAKFGPASLSFQYELDDEGLIQTAPEGDGGNQLHVQGTYSMGATTLILTLGRNDKNIGWAVVASQKVAKKASVYTGYVSNGSGVDGVDSSAFTVGMAIAFGK